MIYTHAATGIEFTWGAGENHMTAQQGVHTVEISVQGPYIVRNFRDLIEDYLAN